MKVKDITYASEQGTRAYQEDRYFVADPACGLLLAVFDGHGGDEAAIYCDEQFSSVFIGAMEEIENPTKAFESSFKFMSSILKQFYSGTTASLVFIPKDENRAYTAVVGDSPIIIGGNRVKWFGPDHNVRTNPKEAEAAQSRGGFLSGGYICKTLQGSGLQMARALGDYALQPVVSSEPEITSAGLMPGDYILVATDGLFDPSHKAFPETAKGITDQIEAGWTAQQLVNLAIAKDTKDNVTAILARF